VYSRPDEDIQHQLAKELIVGTFLCDPDRFTVTVMDGIVTIKGTPETTMAGLDIIDAARHMEGVVAICDRLSYPRTRRTATLYPADGSGDSKEAPMMIPAPSATCWRYPGHWSPAGDPGVEGPAPLGAAAAPFVNDFKTIGK